jgi:predicted ATPase
VDKIKDIKARLEAMAYRPNQCRWDISIDTQRTRWNVRDDIAYLLAEHDKDKARIEELEKLISLTFNYLTAEKPGARVEEVHAALYAHMEALGLVAIAKTEKRGKS